MLRFQRFTKDSQNLGENLRTDHWVMDKNILIFVFMELVIMPW